MKDIYDNYECELDRIRGRYKKENIESKDSIDVVVIAQNDGEDMEQNIIQVVESKDLRDGAEALVKRSIETVEMMIQSDHAKELVYGILRI